MARSVRVSCLVLVGLSLLRCATAAQAHYDGMCGTTRAHRDGIRQKTMRALGKIGYSERMVGTTLYSQSFNPDSFDIRFMWSASGKESLFYQLEMSDTVLWLGCNPPMVDTDGPMYYGFTNYLYLFNASEATGAVKIPGASTGDTLNQLSLKHTKDGAPNRIWGTTSAIIWTADSTSAKDVVSALEAADLPASAINVQVVPSLLRNVKLGLGPASSVFVTGGRIALWKPSPLRSAFFAYREPIVILSAKDRPVALDASPTPALLARGHLPTEKERLSNLQKRMVNTAKRKAILEGWQLVEEVDMQPLTVDVNGTYVYINGTKCIEDPTKSSFCFLDTQDAAYFQLYKPFDFYMHFGMGQMAYVVGIDHSRAGYATYSSVAWQLPKGGPSLTNLAYGGSGHRFAPEVTGSENSFIVQLKQACANETYPPCLPVSEPGHLISRAYLNPATMTGPDPFQLVPATLLRFRPRAQQLNICLVLSMCCVGCVLVSLVLWALRRKESIMSSSDGECDEDVE